MNDNNDAESQYKMALKELQIKLNQYSEAGSPEIKEIAEQANIARKALVEVGYEAAYPEMQKAVDMAKVKFGA
ncbi:MAG: hypothetical protein AAFR21_15980 [Pseudomonadota bacterium]